PVAVEEPASALEEEAPPAAGDEPPALASDVRLYVHGIGRAPAEMIQDTFFIGSSPKCDLWVNGPKIGARHVRIVREGNRYFAENLADSGTVVHGQSIDR